MPARLHIALRIFLLTLVVSFALPAHGAERLQYPIDALPERDLWVGLAFGDAKVGHGHLSILPLGPGRYEIRSETSIFLRMLGFGKAIELRSRETVGEGLELENFEAEYLMDGNRLLISGVRERGRLRVRLDNAGVRSDREFEISGPLLPASAIGLYPLVHGLQLGRSYRFYAFNPESLQVANVEQKVEADGSGFAVHSRFQGVDGVLRLDAAGRMISETAMGGAMRATPATETEARAWLAAARSSDQDVIVDMSLVRTDRHLALPARISRMRVALEGVTIDMPSGTGQRCVRVALLWECDLDNGLREDLDGDAGRWLRPSFTVPSANEAIQRLARETVTEAASDEAKIRALLRWMDANIRKQAADAFTALDVLATRRGECQGHSYLYAALARAAGVPTRVVNGLVYSEQHRGFLYHTWTESLLDGRWRGVDPTFGQPVADATHIKLIEGEDYGDIAPLLDLIGRVGIRIASFDYGR